MHTMKIVVNLLAKILAVTACMTILALFWEYLAGGLLLTVGLLVGLVRLLKGRGQRNDFWKGFVYFGLPMLIAYLICYNFFLSRLIVPWAYLVFDKIDAIMVNLPDQVLEIYHRYFYIDIHSALRPINLVAIHEVAFGVPMLLLSLAGGLLAARISLFRSSAPSG